jgi:uncharacterized membrane protein
MIPLVILLGVYFTFHLEESRSENPRIKPGQSGVYAMAALMACAGVMHFFKVDGLAQMTPLPQAWRVPVVYASGVFEILLAAALCSPRLLRAAGITLALYLVAVTPANIYGAMNHTGLGGHINGPRYLLLRIPLQLFFIYWTVRFCVLAPPVKILKK